MKKKRGFKGMATSECTELWESRAAGVSLRACVLYCWSFPKSLQLFDHDEDFCVNDQSVQMIIFCTVCIIKRVRRFVLILA